MTNYLATLLAASALCAAACSAAQTPAPARPAAAKPAAPASAAPRVATAPAGTGITDTTRYVQAANSGSLTFTFTQAGASNTGAFRQFATEMRYDEKNLAGSSLKVTVQIASLA